MESVIQFLIYHYKKVKSRNFCLYGFVGEKNIDFLLPSKREKFFSEEEPKITVTPSLIRNLCH